MNFDQFRTITQARIGLGHQGPALPTKAWLEFSLHHAQAVDAIAVVWDVERQKNEILKLGFDVLVLNSKVRNREEFLLRPDRGRSLNEPSQKKLQSLKKKPSIALLISNGLSSLALHKHLIAFLKVLMPMLSAENLLKPKDPLLLIPDGRVALIDDVGLALMPSIGITIIGERPGLSAPDSLAAYITYEPKPGRTDAERNCISNIRPPYGLAYEEAAQKLLYLVKASLSLKLSGVSLKDESGILPTQ